MTAGALEALLVVQEHDHAIDRLRHRRETLPERTALDARRRDVAGSDVEVARLQGERDEVLAEERRLDDEARTLGEKAEEMDRKLYSGTVTSPRELQAMQADVEQLRRHRSAVEDRELECMERREGIEARLAEVAAAADGARAEVARLEAALHAQEAEIDVELASERNARAAAAAGVPGALLADYEQRRARNRGSGAARLVGDTCQACRLSIPATEVDRIRHGEAGPVVSCDNCGAILVPS